MNNIFIETKLDNILEQNKKISDNYDDFKSKYYNILEQNINLLNELNNLKLKYDIIAEQNKKISDNYDNLKSKHDELIASKNNKNNVDIQFNGMEQTYQYTSIFVTINNLRLKIDPIQYSEYNYRDKSHTEICNPDYVNNYIKNYSNSYNERLEIYITGHTENLINYLLENKYYSCLKILLFYKFGHYNSYKTKNDLKNTLIPFYDDIIKKNNKIYLELKRLFDFEYFDYEKL